jgi:hypothetical protein
MCRPGGASASVTNQGEVGHAGRERAGYGHRARVVFHQTDVHSGVRADALGTVAPTLCALVLFASKFMVI